MLFKEYCKRSVSFVGDKLYQRYYIVVIYLVIPKSLKTLERRYETVFTIF